MNSVNISILDSLTSHIAVLNAQGIIVAVNKAWRQFGTENGFSETNHSLLGANYLDTCKNAINQPDGDEVNAAQAGIAAVLAGEQESFYLEYPYHSPNQQRWFSMKVSPLQGSVGGVVVSHENITERKLAEIALRASESRFRAIIDASTIPMTLNDAQGNITYLNQICIQTIGYTLADIPTLEDWWSLVYPEPSYRQWVTDIWHSKLAESIRNNQPFVPMERNITCKDGTVRIFMVSISALDDNNFAGTYLVTLYDITERKKMEESLHIAAIAFESQEAMVITDANPIILKVNQAFTRMTGYSAEEAIGNTPSLLKSGKHNKEFYAAMWETLNRDKFWTGEIWNRRKNGELYPEWLSISAVTDNEGQVSNYVAAFTDITISKKLEETIHHLAFYDPLTSLPNRRLMRDRLQQDLISRKLKSHYGAILFIDLNDFKMLNDTKGYDSGDLLLIEISRHLQAAVHEDDTVARTGSNEFVVLVDALDISTELAAMQTETIANRILTSIGQPFNLRGYEYRCSASIGIALFHSHEINVDELIKQADMAMHQAKKIGKNSLCFFDPVIQDALEFRVQLESWMLKALNEQYELYYQLQVDDKGNATGAETLIRWNHPEQGIISPADFIPLAEETGLILPMGQWVLETACTQLKAWEHQQNTEHLVLAVNVSAKQFTQKDFVKQVLATLEKTGADPNKLKLELTESMLVTNIEDIIAKMNSLRIKGVKFSLDDFGTGFSSLSYLKRLPLDQLKIDQSFVRDSLTDPSDAAIINAVIALGQSLGMEVIAEGVETQAQRTFLEVQGCTHYQGYFFSRPLPLNEFEQLLHNF
ncbi:MAG: EAL domain-containing protein [Methylococcales bacterium]|nr:EAL domain-containing protein [Methylococcales bacterium]